MPKYCQKPKRTAKTIFDPGPGPRRAFVDDGRAKVTEMKNFGARKLRLGIVSFLGVEWGGDGGVIFGPRILFWFRRETDKSVLIKLHGKKKK